MEKSGNNIAEHVRSAKMWLEKAEQSFDRKSDIQGELNLMLAEAEMKNLRKNYGLNLRARLRIAAALSIAVICAGVWYGLTRTDASPVLPVQQQAQPVQEAEPVSAESMPAASAEAVPSEPYADTLNHADEVKPVSSFETRNEADSAVPVLEEAAEPAQLSAPAPKEVLTDAQIQQAVQDARHSLRGTELKNK